MEETSTLTVIEGDYGLISLDLGCIQAILYAKLKKIPVEITIQNSLKSCAFYNAPSWKSGQTVIETFPKIFLHWRKVYGNLDESLSARECSETLALVNLARMKLEPVLQFLYWVDQRNSEEFINKWFMKALPLPFNYSYTKRKTVEATQLMETLYPCDTDLEVIKDYITKTATQCLSTLSTRLGKSKFFYGDEPLTLDVVVYSHIAPLVKLPFPSNDIPAILSMWPNLTEFVKRIDQKYFSEVKKDVKYLPVENPVKQNDDEVSYAAVFILLISATSLVVGFAMKRGFLKVPTWS